MSNVLLWRWGGGPEKPGPRQGPARAVHDRHDRHLVAHHRLGLVVGSRSGRRIAGRNGLGDRGVEVGRAPMAIVVRFAGAEQHTQKVVPSRVVGDPAERPHLRRIGRQAIEIALVHRLRGECHPQLPLDLHDDRFVEPGSIGQEGRRREAGTGLIARVGQQLARVGRVVRRDVIRIAPTRDPRRDHRTVPPVARDWFGETSHDDHDADAARRAIGAVNHHHDDACLRG